MGFHKTIRRGGALPPSLVRRKKGGYPREYTHKGNDNAILYQILTCADCLGAATDSVGRLITVEREQLYREVFGKKKRGAGSITLVSVYGVNSYIRIL